MCRCEGLGRPHPATVHLSAPAWSVLVPVTTAPEPAAGCDYEPSSQPIAMGTMIIEPTKINCTNGPITDND